MAATRYRHGHTPRTAGSLTHLHAGRNRGTVNAAFAAAVARRRAADAEAATQATAATPAPRTLADRRLAAVQDRRAADYAQLRNGPRAVTLEWAAEELNITVKTVRDYVRTGRLELTELGVRTYAVTRIDNAIKTGTVGWLAADNPPARKAA